MAVKDIDKFKGECKIATWLCQIAKYIWYKDLRKRKNEIPLEQIENTNYLEKSMEEIVCESNEKIELLKKIQNLDNDTRTVMHLRILGNLEYSEIATIMNKTANWARVTFFRGKEKIREERKS